MLKYAPNGWVPDGEPLKGDWMMTMVSPSVDEFIGELILNGPFGDRP